MKTVFDYLVYYKDVLFDSYSFNDVDSLIFSLLSYVKFEGIVPKDKKESISLYKACELFLEKFSEKDVKKEDWLFPISYKLVKLLVNSKRFYYVKLYHLVTTTDSKGQFGAITFRLPNGITYIAYEGTDSSVVGWKEDFELMFQYPIASQILSEEYFNDTLNLFDREIYVGGHSKGGNLAMYAYMNGKSYYKKRVKLVYNFDGPGFLDDILFSSLYQEMSTKLRMFVPKDSVVGMILGHGEYVVVNSKNKAIMQHDASSWECFGGYFATTTLSKKSEKLEQNLKEYLNGMSLDEKKSFVKTFFAIFEKSSITNIMQLKEFKISTLLSILKEVTNVPSSTKRNLVAILRMLITGMN